MVEWEDRQVVCGSIRLRVRAWGRWGRDRGHSDAGDVLENQFNTCFPSNLHQDVGVGGILTVGTSQLRGREITVLSCPMTESTSVVAEALAAGRSGRRRRNEDHPLADQSQRPRSRIDDLRDIFRGMKLSVGCSAKAGEAKGVYW